VDVAQAFSVDAGLAALPTGGRRRECVVFAVWMGAAENRLASCAVSNEAKFNSVGIAAKHLRNLLRSGDGEN